MTQTCDSCQAVQDDEAKFCSGCGQDLGEDAGAPIEWPPRMPERPRPRIFGAVLGALIVWTILVVIFATFVYMVANSGTPAGV